MDERRKQPRIKVNWPIQINTGNGLIEGIAKNITVNGVFVCCEEPLLLKKNISINMFPPNCKPINIIGKPVWSDSYALALDEDMAPTCVGLSFILSVENHHLLKKIIETYIDSQNT